MRTIIWLFVGVLSLVPMNMKLSVLALPADAEAGQTCPTLWNGVPGTPEYFNLPSTYVCYGELEDSSHGTVNDWTCISPTGQVLWWFGGPGVQSCYGAIVSSHDPGPFAGGYVTNTEAAAGNNTGITSMEYFFLFGPPPVQNLYNAQGILCGTTTNGAQSGINWWNTGNPSCYQP